MAREIKIERVDEDYNEANDAVTLKIGAKFLRILVPKDNIGYIDCAFDAVPDGTPIGLNLVCRDHYT